MFQKVRRKLARISGNISFFAENVCQMIKNIKQVPTASQKLKQFRSDCFDIRIMHRLMYGYRTCQITAYDDEFVQNLKQYHILGTTVFAIINDFKPDEDSNEVGHCLERSFLMFLCNHDSVWVYGNNQNLAIKHGKQNSTHAWVEVGNFVYDPTTIQRYPKKLYYNMLKINHVKKLTYGNYQQNGVDENLITMLKKYIRTIKPCIEKRIKKQKNNNEISFDY